MNILLISSSFLPNVGGVERITYHLATEYQAKGHNAGVITNLWPDDLPENEKIAGIVTHRLHMALPALNPAVSMRFITALKSTTDRIVKIIKGGRYELLHIMSAGPNAFYAHAVHQLTELPLVTTFQGSDLRQFTRDSFFARWSLKKTLNDSAAITACSQDLLDEAVGGNKKWSAKARVIYNGIDPNEFDAMKEEDAYRHPRPYVLGMGRLIHIKGFDLLIRAFATFGQEFADYDLIIAGDGEERKSLEELAQNLGVEERVRFWGWADREDAIRLFKGCAFSVCPSRQEGMGIVCLEAGLARAPMIAARVGGIPEVITDGENGLLFKPDDAAALAVAMRRVASNPDLSKSLGAAGRNKALERFSWPAIADQYIKVYQSVL